ATINYLLKNLISRCFNSYSPICLLCTPSMGLTLKVLFVSVPLATASFLVTRQ
uniref:Uncharacterized protein n=1 Tax=Amphimedon queenslandica TaxID=400682 RepID=A0A1X7UCA7_AMPQE